MFRFNGDFDEMSYPFIYEQSALCDFELLTDELCTVTGLAGSACSENDADIQSQLFELQPKLFDLNGSIRGRNAIHESDLEKLKSWLTKWRAEAGDPRGFVLPRGTGVVVPLHYCRSLSKKVTRALVRVEAEGVDVPVYLPRYSNVLTNLYFALAQVVNGRNNVEQPEYISSNYGKPA